MKAHGAQLRASGDPYFSHPVEVAGILARMKLDTASIVTGLLHDTVEDTVATLDDIERRVRAGDRAAGRRRDQAVADRAAIRSDQAGREFPQARPGDVRRHPRAAGQAGRPAAQHADPAVHQERRKAPPDRARDDGHLCAAGRADRHAPDEGPARGSRLRRALSRCARAASLARLDFLRDKGAARRAAHRRRARAQARGGRARRRGRPGREKSPYSIWRKMQRKNVAFEQLSDVMAFRVLVDDIADCYHALGIIHSAYHVVPGRFKDYISTPEAQQLPLAAHRRDRARAAAHRDADPHPRDARGRRARRCRALDLQAGRRHDRRTAIPLAARTARHPRPCLGPGGIPRAHQARDVPGSGLRLHPEGRSDRACRAARRRSISPMRCIRRSATPASAPRSTAGWCRCAPSSATAIRSRSSPRRRRRPSPTWERFVVTGKARARIRRFVRTQQRAQYLDLGKAIVQKAFRQEGHEFSERPLEAVLKTFQLRGRRGSLCRGRRRARHRASGDQRRLPAAPGSQGARSFRWRARGARRTQRHCGVDPRPDPRHGAAFRRLLPSAARRPHRRHRHHRQGGDDPHDRLRHARKLRREPRNAGSMSPGAAARPMRSMSAGSTSRSPTSPAISAA